MRAAVLGLGWWGRELAAAAMRSNGAVEIARGCSISAADRAAFAARFGLPVGSDAAEVMADPSIAGVIIATPHTTRLPLVAAAAQAGKHVLVEKPLALSPADARASVAACAAAGVTLAVGHNRRLLPQVGMLRKLIDDGVLGALVHVEANFSTGEALAFPPGHWRTDRRECPGGAMTVLGVHVIDWMHVLFGDVRTVSAQFSRRSVATDMDDAASALLTFESGLTATLVTLYAVPYRNTFVVHGSEATASIVADGPETPSLRPELIVRRHDGNETRSAMPYVDTLARQLECWVRACREGGEPAVGGIEGARNIAVLDAIARAAAGGRPVAVDYAGLI